MNLFDLVIIFFFLYVGCYVFFIFEKLFIVEYGGEEEVKWKVEMFMVYCYCFIKEIEIDKVEIDIL